MTKKHLSPASSGMPSQRQLRVGELVRHAVSEMLSRGELADPALEGLIVTVPEVRMSTDLKIATVYVMPLGGQGADKIVKALARNVKPLRRGLAPRLGLKFVPDLRFRYDDTFDEAERIGTILRSPEVVRDLQGGEDET